MPDFTCLDENLFAKVAQTLLQHISSTHCNFKSALGPSILLLCVRLADVQMNGFINYCGRFNSKRNYIGVFVMIWTKMAFQEPHKTYFLHF